MRGRLESFKKIETQPDEGESKVTTILILIRQLYEMRMVEKICRPWAYLHKEQLYKQFKQKFLYLHELMILLQKQYQQDNGQLTQRNKSHQKSNVNIRSRYQKEDIRKIQNRYTQVFIQGSFRYYYRAAKASGMPTDLYALNIEEWLEETLKDDEESKCC